VEAYILLLKEPPEDLDATDLVVTQEEALQLLRHIKKGADIKDHLSRMTAVSLFCRAALNNGKCLLPKPVLQCIGAGSLQACMKGKSPQV